MKLYDYQQTIVNLAETNTRGIFCLPTGTGKTFCQAAILSNEINSNFGIYVINAPRILLTFQLMKEVYSFLTQKNIEALYMFVHSGGTIDTNEFEDIRKLSNIPYSQIHSATTVNEIENKINNAKELNLPLIFFSTYNSCQNIEIARQRTMSTGINIVLNDEAHYLIQEQFHNILTTLPSNKCFFFTATTIHTPSDKGRGMNNVESYGELLFNMTPREAIDKGKMVRPRIHILTTNGVYTSDDYSKSISKLIFDSYKEHSNVIKQNAKLLVSVKGTMDIMRFLKSREYRTLRENEINICVTSSNPIVGNRINEDRVSRQVFLKRLKSLGETVETKLIVLHFDILSEGIDVSGFTGLLPLRTLSKSKFLQTYGRCARLDKNDRLTIEDIGIENFKLEDWNKPYSYIIIPNVIQSNEDDKANLTNLIYELREYEFKTYEDIVSISYVNGIPELEQLSGVNELIQRFPNVGQLIDNIESTLEDEVNAKLNRMEYLSKLFTF